jgi:hypothetical protein
MGVAVSCETIYKSRQRAGFGPLSSKLWFADPWSTLCSVVPKLNCKMELTGGITKYLGLHAPSRCYDLISLGMVCIWGFLRKASKHKKSSSASNVQVYLGTVVSIIISLNKTSNPDPNVHKDCY